MTSFVVLSFADLKKYKFHYHFAFPAFQSSPSWELERGKSIERLSPDESCTLYEKINTWKYISDTRQHGFFLVKRRKVPVVTKRGSDDDDDDSEIDHGWDIGNLGDYERGFFDEKPGETICDKFIGFTDPSTEAENPGWPLRNLLVLVRKRWGLNKVKVLCHRETKATRELNRSFIMPLEISGDLSSSQLSMTGALFL